MAIDNAYGELIEPEFILIVTWEKMEPHYETAEAEVVTCAVCNSFIQCTLVCFIYIIFLLVPPFS